MHRRLLRGDEARSHIHAGGAERQRGHQATRIGHAARCHEWNLQLFCRARQQNHVGHVVFTGMATAFKAVDAHGVAADLLGLERVPHGCALVDHLDAGRLQRGHELFGTAPGGLDDFDLAFSDRCDVFRIWRRGEGRQEGQVHSKRLVRHVMAAGDLLCQ